MKIKNNIIGFLMMASLSHSVVAEKSVYEASSPDHQVALLELYTSEGCSSCPPADRYLSSLYSAGFSEKQLIPLSMHVTYWDYIGWKDPYASIKYDNRQRRIARFDRARTIYTPQLVLNGSDYRQYNTLGDNLRRVVANRSKVDMTLQAVKEVDQASVKLGTQLNQGAPENLEYYIALFENNLVSEVNDGENEGVTLKHDYVVRSLHGPFKQSVEQQQASFNQTVHLASDWKSEDMGLVAYALDPADGKIVQAVRIKFE